MDQDNDDQQRQLSFWQVLGSIFASAIGVQKHVNRERDFAYGRPIHYIMGGLIFTVLFIVTILVVVNIAIS